MLIPRNRKEIIGFCRPSTIRLIQCVQITRRCRIEQIDITSIGLLNRRFVILLMIIPSNDPYLCIDIFDQFLQIFKPFIGIFIMKITTHRHHDMIRCKTLSLKEKSVDEFSSYRYAQNSLEYVLH